MKIKKPVVMENDVKLVGAAIALSAVITVAMFKSYRFGRRAEVKELIDIASNEGGTKFTFKTGKKYETITKIYMAIIE